MGNSRLVNTTATFSGSSGFTLDGVELTKEEYAAWMGAILTRMTLWSLNVAIGPIGLSHRTQHPRFVGIRSRQDPCKLGPINHRSALGTVQVHRGSPRRSISWIVILVIILIFGSGVIGEIEDLIFNVLDGF